MQDTSITRRSPYLAFVPWLVLGFVTRYSTLQVASAAALAVAIAVSVPSFAARRPKLLEVASIIAFLAFLIVAILTHAGRASILYRYARARSLPDCWRWIAFGSLLFVPFTEQYARETVPRELWSTPTFKQTNRLFTAGWGGVFAVMTVSHIIADAINTTRGETIFNWVIPIIVIGRAIAWMNQYRAAHVPDPSVAPAAPVGQNEIV